jgi:hypothetical protein
MMRRPFSGVRSLKANKVTEAVYIALGYTYQKIRAMHDPVNVTATKGTILRG